MGDKCEKCKEYFAYTWKNGLRLCEPCVNYENVSAGVTATGTINTGVITYSNSSNTTFNPVLFKAAWKRANMKIPELYPENLDTLKTLMARIETLSRIEGIFEIELRVRLDDLDTWAVIGYGEAGDPCLLRFDPGA